MLSAAPYIVRKESTNICPWSAKSPAVIRVFVVFPIAEQTIIGLYPFSTCLRISLR